MNSNTEAKFMSTQCPHCQQHYEISQEHLGQITTCQACGKNFTITQPETPTKVSMENDPPQAVNATMPCPFCGETILAVAKKCKHCGEFLDKNGIKPTMRINGIQLPANNRILGGWVAIILGALGLLFTLITIFNEKGKWGEWYKPSEGTIMLLVISGIVLTLGFYLSMSSLFRHFLECWKKYAVFKGRACRKEFWGFLLFYFLIGLAIGFFSMIIKIKFITTGYGLAALIPLLAVSSRRLHDTGRSGWWSLTFLSVIIPLIGIIGLIVGLILCAKKGTHGNNVYGPDPRT